MRGFCFSLKVCPQWYVPNKRLNLLQSYEKIIASVLFFGSFSFAVASSNPSLSNNGFFIGRLSASSIEAFASGFGTWLFGVAPAPVAAPVSADTSLVPMGLFVPSAVPSADPLPAMRGMQAVPMMPTTYVPASITPVRTGVATWGVRSSSGVPAFQRGIGIMNNGGTLPVVTVPPVIGSGSGSGSSIGSKCTIGPNSGCAQGTRCCAVGAWRMPPDNGTCQLPSSYICNSR